MTKTVCIPGTHRDRPVGDKEEQPAQQKLTALIDCLVEGESMPLTTEEIREALNVRKLIIDATITCEHSRAADRSVNRKRPMRTA